MVLGEKHSSKMYAFVNLDSLIKLLDIMHVLLNEDPMIVVGEGGSDYE